jgi:hypothetical protein
MTREEAIEVIKSECYVFNPLNFDSSTRINTALDVAVKALEQEPCEDAVSRQAVLKKFENRFIELQKAHQKEKQLGVNWCINTLNDMPPVTPTWWIAPFKRNQELNKSYKIYRTGRK